MLELRPGCECCDKDLPPDSADARICTFECTRAASLLRELRGRRAQRPLPELRRRSGRAPEAAGKPAREVPGVDGTHRQAGRLRERLTARRHPPLSVTTSRSAPA